MKKTIQFIVATAGFAAMALTACNNNDTGKPGDTTVAPGDSMTAPANSNMMDTSSKMMNDTAMKKMDTATRNMTGMSSPNPAKKGMKGRVTVAGMQHATGAMESDKEGVYGNAEVLPSYPGGEKALANYFANNLQYPADALDQGVEGTVMINFVVDEKGHAYMPQVTSPAIGYGIEDEAMRVFNKMPNWTPGKMKGKNVKTRYTIPLTFQLY